MAKQSTEYKAEYTKTHYARIEFTIPKHAKPMIEAAAAACGEKPTEYVKKAVMQRMGLETWPDPAAQPLAADMDAAITENLPALQELAGTSDTNKYS